METFYEESISFSQEDVIRFSEITGDRNPIHLNEEYASATIFKRPIIHGFLAASVFSKILGTVLPGEGTIYSKQELEFLKPMYVGNEYRARVSVTDVDKTKGKIVLDTSISSQSGEVAVKGSAVVYNMKYKETVST